MGNEPCADNYGPVNVMKLRERIFQETEREKAQAESSRYVLCSGKTDFKGTGYRTDR